MSVLGDFADRRPRPMAGALGFHQIRPQVLRRVLSALDDAIGETVRLLGDVPQIEPRFTRQLAACFEDARDAVGGVRYHIDHQAELPVVDAGGRVIAHRRLDIRLLFTQQVGRRGDYLGIECKYTDASDRRTDDDYVGEGVDRIVSGAYAAGHPVAIMVGLERVGPLGRTITNVDARLQARYGPDQGLRAASSWRLPMVRESEHPQAGGPHRIVLVHGFWPVTAAAAA